MGIIFILVILPLIGYVVASLFFRRRYRSGQGLIGRAAFVAYALLFSQLLFVLTFVVMMVMSSGFILYAVANLALFDALGVVLLAVFSFFRYPHLVSGVGAGSAEVDASRLSTKHVGPVGILLLAVLFVCAVFFGFGGFHALRATFGTMHSTYYAAVLLKMPSLCYHVEDSMKLACFFNADTDYWSTMKDCPLRANIDLKLAEGEQASCLRHMFLEMVKGKEEIQCDAIREKYSANSQLNYTMDVCNSTKKLGEVVRSGRPELCRGYFDGNYQTGLRTDEEYMTCLSFFMGTDEWRRTCKEFEKHYSSWVQEAIGRAACPSALKIGDQEPLKQFIDVVAYDEARVATSTYEANLKLYFGEDQ